ncbi:piggyBac transposable element-derived protein 3-like [Ostrinia nubilalis]|uniref:piggyBac transposable element-derived protein 3-like n=1 Tax=Ostrinia nubilalis TaxID=29057 RepID=UPI0030822C24
MSSKRSKPLSLHEILIELENSNDPVPEYIAFEPPDNANTIVTDEDSGDEDNITIHNLPGSILRAPAKAVYTNCTTSDSENEDDIPLASLQKRPRTEVQQPLPSTSTSNTSSNEDVTLIRPTSVENKTYHWRNRHTANEFQSFQPLEGPKNELRPPINYFDQLFNDTTINLLVEYTNLYATQKNKAGNITFSEMKCFIGILLYSGYVSLPRRRMYWENSTDCEFSLVNRSLSRDRFTYILNHLHCCDNSLIQTQTDKFAKMRPLFRLLNTIFQENAPAEEMHSIDEAMIPYYGGHSCKQFIRGKPIRWGYKYWVGATRLGYVIWFDPYQGKSAQLPSIYKKFGLGGSVILQYANVLQTMYPDNVYHLFFDNYFTSIPLLHELKNRNLKATGTVRENRTSKCPLPTNQDFKKTDRGSFAFKASLEEQILVCKWNDNSVVTVASNAESIEPLQTTKRFSQNLKKYINIDQPHIIKLYNENMGGVDRSDQNIGLYRTCIRE